MRISTRGEYGIRAMLDLALHHGQGPISLKVIAERQNISDHYLEQLMAALRKAGLVTSVRGAQGGYELMDLPEKIRAGDIIRALEGPIAPMNCVEEANPAHEESCSQRECCAARTLWKRLQESMESVLDGTTLEDLCQETMRLQAASDALMYYI